MAEQCQIILKWDKSTVFATFNSYNVVMDGFTIGKWDNGKTMTILTSPGKHILSFSTWGHVDREISVFVNESDSIFEICALRNSWSGEIVFRNESTSQMYAIQSGGYSSSAQPMQTSRKGHPVLGTVLLIIALIMIFSAAQSGGNSSKNTPKKVEDTASVPSASASVAPEKTTFGVGEKVELRNVVVTLLSVTTNNGSQYNKPTDGNEFVVCEFEIENNTDKDIAISSMLSFEAYFDDYAANYSLSALLSASDKSQLDGTIAAGKKMKGVVGYEAPTDWKVIEVKINPNFWAGKKITFTAEHP